MKQIKKGFSLAEVLIAMGIISIIATIGFTLGRRGVESAYNQYIYTGYKGMSMAIANAVNEGLEADGMSEASREGSAANNFVDSLIETLNGDNINYPPGGNQVTFRVPNGTVFGLAGNGSSDVTISMEVPAKKTRRTSTATVCLDYLPNRPYGGVLIPVHQGISCVSTIPNISTRKDLLPFFIDNGIAGRVIPDKNGNLNNPAEYKFDKRQYYSIQEALCRAYGGSTEFRGADNSVIVNCNAIGNPSSVRGAIKVADPRKVN